jgi:glycosyltransferase involved in cell wall biosynthesis
MSTRFISIGLPVYNGGETLRRALDGLIAQTHSHFELIISDNASTDDETQAITEEYAGRDSRIRLTRQPVNLGAVQNFMWVLEQAHGDYFMWAAHDDFWSQNYVEVLANRLDASAEAILASPQSHVATTRRNGNQEQEVIPAAPNSDRNSTLNVYLNEFKSCLWIYGLYRREWLATAAGEWTHYPWFNGDIIWLWGVLLTERIVGDDAATFFYTADHRLRKKETYRQTVQKWGTTFYHLTRLSWQRLPPDERARGILKAWRYVFLHHLWKKNPFATSIRIVKLALLWIWIGLEAGMQMLTNQIGSVASQFRDRATRKSLPASSLPMIDDNRETRHAA